jgi:antitoxin (DNA-binding transcriptional repressor) of toxin-antitoxin stability system
MKEITASIRELKSRLSHYLRLAKRGQIVEITERVWGASQFLR